jgi:hypothetical protein
MARKTGKNTKQKPVSRIEKAIEEVLKGENADPLLQNLSADDQKLLQEALAELRSSPDMADAYLRDLWRLDYERKPPSMTEFLEDPYWLGSLMMKSEESEGMFPTWKKLLIQDFDLDSRVHNLVVSGSLGIGKTFVTVTILLYRIVLARCLRNPQAFFGLTKGSAIFYATLSVTRSVVQETAFGDFLNFMTNSPFFVEECHFNPEKKYASFRIPLGKSIYLTAGSQGWHIIGRNAMGVALDEGNFRLEANPDLKAYKLYDEVRTRIRNRFQRMAGFLPAISILSSSARDESSFTERVKTDIEKSKATDPDQRIYSYPVYVIKQHTLTLSPKWFKVAYGLKNVDPFILKGSYDKKGNPIDDGEMKEEPPPGAKVELVPYNYIEDFRRNVKNALQNVSGISTGGSFRFISNQIDLEKAIEAGESTGIVAPHTTTQLPISEEDKSNIWDFLNPKLFLTKQMSRFQPKRDPFAARYCHIDLATRTQAGLSICHIAGRQLVQGLVKDGGEVFDEYRVVVEYDFILSIVAGKSKPISIIKVINFLYWLRDVCGYRFALVTADQFQSALPLQMLENKGFKTANLSVDRSKKPYEAWRAGFEERRIRMFRHPILLTEAENLVDLVDKVDHLPDQSKDVCDSAAGCYYSAITFKDDRVTNSAFGAEPSIYTNLNNDDDEKPLVNPVNLDQYRKPTKSFTV